MTISHECEKCIWWIKEGQIHFGHGQCGNEMSAHYWNFMYANDSCADFEERKEKSMGQ